jgi:hypothetical protein
VEADAADVVLGVLGDHRDLAAGDVELHQAAGVGPHRRHHPHAGAVQGEGDGRRGQRVVLAPLQQGPPVILLGVPDHDDHAAVGQGGEAGPNLEVGVGEKADETRVGHDLLDLARLQVEAVDVVKLGVVLVQTDEDGVREALVGLVHPGLHALERGDVLGLAALEVDREEVPVLVAADVLDIEQVTVVVGPEERPDAAVPVVGDRLRLVELGADLVDPDVQHSVVGGDPRQALAVRGDAGADALRVAEQDLAGDEGCGAHGCQPRRSRPLPS